MPQTPTKLELLEKLPLFDSCSRGELRLAERHAELIHARRLHESDLAARVDSRGGDEPHW